MFKIIIFALNTSNNGRPTEIPSLEFLILDPVSLIFKNRKSGTKFKTTITMSYTRLKKKSEITTPNWSEFLINGEKTRNHMMKRLLKSLKFIPLTL